MKYLLLILCSLVLQVSQAQVRRIHGTVRDAENRPISGASVFIKGTSLVVSSDSSGFYSLGNVPAGDIIVGCFLEGKKIIEREVKPNMVRVDFILQDLKTTLKEVKIQGQNESEGISHLQAIDNFGFYEAKKNEVVELGDLVINTSTNNSRQLYSKVSGLNIWESDQAGLQLGIGGRGLNPDRTSNFNTRQNGYDISADALGYPESYYTPPAEALERIEVIRGASSLQYGTQFGGMVNFRFKKGPAEKPIEFTTRQTGGSWGYFGSFNSLGGTVAKGKLNYYTYYNYKCGDGYRENSDFTYHNAFASLRYEVNDRLEIDVDVTKMHYLAHQPGGLTDKLFEEDPEQSVRNRNWFTVDWNLFALSATYRFSPRTQLNTRNFLLKADRASVGNLERINVADLGGNRTLIDGDFNNFGNETRLIHRYQLADKTSALLVGFRVYHGTTRSRQGDGSDGSDPDFHFLHPDDLENSSYEFPNKNYAFFAEDIFDLTDKLSLTPGIRLENIRTYSEGFYKQYVYDAAGNIIVENTIPDSRDRKRTFLIAGLGISYRVSDQMELYGNISQNYRAINFSDLRLVNPNIYVDPDIRDERGFTADLGWRGKINTIFSYDISSYYLSYQDKIGQVLRADQPPLYNDYRYRGNISDARTVGIEALGQINFSEVLDITPAWLFYVNTSLTDSRYVHSEDSSVDGNEVEMVPPVIVRAGSSLTYRKFSLSAQYSYSARHFTDATNAERTATAIEGVIPSYHIVDLSASYIWKKFTFEANCNNVLNTHYFTRRADSYPGPGIIPSDGRGFYLTLMAQF